MPITEAKLNFEFEATDEGLASVLVSVVESVPVDHTVQLEALLIALQQMARKHSCCAEGVCRACIRLSMEMAKLACVSQTLVH